MCPYPGVHEAFYIGGLKVKEKTYRVTWQIDIDADSPEDAARQALDIQRDHESLATFFDVREPSGNNVEVDVQD